MAHYDGHVEAAQEAYVRKIEAENAQLKAELEELRSCNEATMRDYADLLDVPPHHCTAWGDLYHRIRALKADLARCQDRLRELKSPFKTMSSNSWEQLTTNLAQAMQREARLREALESAIKWAKDITWDWPNDLETDHITMIVTWEKALEEAGT